VIGEDRVPPLLELSPKTQNGSATPCGITQCSLQESDLLGTKSSQNHIHIMSETPTMDKVVLPADEDFEEFRTHCSSDEGWNEVYKDAKYKVWTKKVCNLHFQL